MDDQFHQHGIVVCRYFVVVVNMCVHTDAVAAWDVDIGDQSWTWHEILFRIFRVDSALDGMACDLYVFLGYA